MVLLCSVGSLGFAVPPHPHHAQIAVEYLHLAFCEPVLGATWCVLLLNQGICFLSLDLATFLALDLAAIHRIRITAYMRDLWAFLSRCGRISHFLDLGPYELSWHIALCEYSQLFKAMWKNAV